MSALLGRKVGITSLFTDAGEYVPCTVLEAGPCTVTAVRTKANDGYEAIQIGYGKISSHKTTKPVAGQFAKAKLEPMRHLREFRNVMSAYAIGDVITVEAFEVGDQIKVSGKSKGRGFQGVVKRHGFGGVGMQTHGQSDRPRAPGSIGQSSYPSRVFKGTKMAGRMGGTRVSVRNLDVLRVIPESNLLLIKGSIPGPPNSIVEIVKL